MYVVPGSLQASFYSANDHSMHDELGDVCICNVYHYTVCRSC